MSSGASPQLHPYSSFLPTFSSASSLITIKGFSEPRGNPPLANQPATSLAPWLNPSLLWKESACVNRGWGRRPERPPFLRTPLMWHGLGAHCHGHLSLLDKRAICHRQWFPGKHPRGAPFSRGVPGSPHLSLHLKHPVWVEQRRRKACGWHLGNLPALPASPSSLTWGVETDPSTGLNFPLGPEDPEISRTGSQGLGEGSGPLPRLPSHPERAPLVSFTFAIRCKILVDQRKPFFYLSSAGTISGADGPRSGSGCPASALGLLTSG